MTPAKTRSSNIELLRILAMFMIIIFHISDHCVKVQLTDTASMLRMNNGLFCEPVFYQKLLLLSTFAPMGKIGNVIFITISGYFMVPKENGINLAKISKKLLLQLGFAAVSLTLVSSFWYRITDGVFLKLVNINKFNSMSWFVGYYFFIMVIAYLFLNKFLAKLDKQKYFTFLIVLFAFIQFRWTGSMANSLANGLRTLLTGIFLYALGGFIHLYNPFGKIRTYCLYLIIAISFLFIYISAYNVTQTNIQTYFLNESKDIFIQKIPSFSDYSIIPILVGLSLFEIFRHIHIPCSRMINFVGASTFMVYLLHDNAFAYSLWNTQDWITLLYEHPYIYLFKHLRWAVATFLIGILFYIIYLCLGKALSKCRWLVMKE